MGSPALILAIFARGSAAFFSPLLRVDFEIFWVRFQLLHLRREMSFQIRASIERCTSTTADESGILRNRSWGGVAKLGELTVSFQPCGQAEHLTELRVDDCCKTWWRQEPFEVAYEGANTRWCPRSLALSSSWSITILGEIRWAGLVQPPWANQTITLPKTDRAPENKPNPSNK